MKIVGLIILIGGLCASLFAETRVWTDAGGQPVDGVFERVLFGDILIRDLKNNIHQIPLANLSQQDIHYLHYQVHPEIEIDFVKITRELPQLEWTFPQDVITLYTCTVELEKKNNFSCKDKLTAELYIIAEEVDGDNYMLIQRDVSRFIFPESKKSIHEFTVEDIPIRKYYEGWAEQEARFRGAIYLGYLITVMDSKGQLITHKTDLSNMDWLLNDMPASVAKLRELAIQGRGSVHSRHFDESLEKSAVPRIPWYVRSKSW